MGLASMCLSVLCFSCKVFVFGLVTCGGRMRRILFFLPLLLAACSEKAPEAVEANGPDVGISSAPGIAVNYRYGFRLPVERIAATQEDHAAQCEALGPATCRVAGMTYHVGRDRSVGASLELRLAPDVARHFGRQAIDTVGKHGGMLIDARIDSEEAGATLAMANADNASRTAERTQIEQQLAKPGLPATERVKLQERRSFLADTNRQTASVASDAAFKLSQTPVTLDYQSGDVDLSLSDGPILGSIKDGWSNIVSGFAIILLIAITLVPWLAALTLVGWGVHRLQRRFSRPEAPARHDDAG